MKCVEARRHQIGRRSQQIWSQSSRSSRSAGGWRRRWLWQACVGCSSLCVWGGVVGVCFYLALVVLSIDLRVGQWPMRREGGEQRLVCVVWPLVEAWGGGREAWGRGVRLLGAVGCVECVVYCFCSSISTGFVPPSLWCVSYTCVVCEVV